MTTKEGHVTGHVTRSPSAQRGRRIGRMSSQGGTGRVPAGIEEEGETMRRPRAVSVIPLRAGNLTPHGCEGMRRR